MSTKFYAAEDVQEIVERLIETCAEFEHLQGLSIKAIFRDKHTKYKGKPVGAKCNKQNDMQRLLHGIDFLIVVANDVWIHLSDHQKEAVCYHELCHAAVNEDTETGEVTPALMPHDCEMFFAELKKYGPWFADLEALVNTVKQLDLFKDQKVTQLRKPKEEKVENG